MKTSMSKERVGRMWILTWAVILAAVMAQAPETCLGAGKQPSITLRAAVGHDGIVHTNLCVYLYWNDIPLENGYRVYVNGSPWGSSLPANTTSMRVGGLQPSTYYTFQIRSIGSSPLFPSVSSNVVGVTMPRS